MDAGVLRRVSDLQVHDAAGRDQAVDQKRFQASTNLSEHVLRRLTLRAAYGDPELSFIEAVATKPKAA